MSGKPCSPRTESSSGPGALAATVTSGSAGRRARPPVTPPQPSSRQARVRRLGPGLKQAPGCGTGRSPRDRRDAQETGAGPAVSSSEDSREEKGATQEKTAINGDTAISAPGLSGDEEERGQEQVQAGDWTSPQDVAAGHRPLAQTQIPAGGALFPHLLCWRASESWWHRELPSIRHGGGGGDPEGPGARKPHP